MGGIGSFVEGLAGGIQQGQKQAMAKELQDMQLQHLKATSKAQELELRLNQMKLDVLGSAPPEDRSRLMFGNKAMDPIAILKALQGQGAPQEVPLPDYEPGQGMPPFRPGATMTLPQKVAQGQFGGMQLGSIDLGTGSVKLEPVEYQSVRGVAVPGMQGPQTIRVPKNAAGTFAEHQAPDMVTEQLGSGETVEYKVDKITNQAIPGTMRIKQRVQPVQLPRVLPDGTQVTESVNPFTGAPAGGEVTITPPGGKSARVTGLAPVEEFKFTDNDGIEKSVIRNKVTGVPVTTPIPTGPPKGALSTEGGKYEGITKGLENIKKIRSAIIKKDGSVNNGLVLKMWAPAGGVGEGRQMNSLFREALDVKIRAMTGAAISKEELPFYEQTYLPHPLDPDSVKIDKMNRLESFLQGFGASIDPGGVAAKRIQKATGGKPNLTPGKKDAIDSVIEYVRDPKTGMLIPKGK